MNVEVAYEAADALYVQGKRTEAKEALQMIIDEPVDADHTEGIRCKEQSVYRLGELYTMEKDPHAIILLLRSVRPFFTVLPKAKTTKIVRKLFDSILVAGATLNEQQAVCVEMIEWSRNEKRTFLRHRLQHRLAQVLFDSREHLAALAAITSLLKEVRRLDDRSLLVDVHLLESKIYYSIRNVSKSRAALVAARTNANAIYCPPLAQAEIDLQSGVLHAEEKDAKTAFSYFYEAFEGFHQLGDHARQARQALRYMILSKILTDNQDELKTILSTKNVLEYQGDDIVALRGIAEAYSQQDTHSFNTVMTSHGSAFGDDSVVKRHLEDMYSSLLEKHLVRVTEPYNRVQIEYVAEVMKLEPQVVEARLSQMILDKKLHGIVDQQYNCLVLFEAAEKQSKDAHAVLFQDTLEALENLDKLVTSLFDKVAGKFDQLAQENIKKSKEGDKADKKKGDKDGKDVGSK